MLKVDKFNVRIVFTGEGYGLNDCIINEESVPLVEFYDSRYQSPRSPRGQFVSRYYASTLLNGDTDTRGLSLDGGIPEWTVSAEDMKTVHNHLKTTLFPNLFSHERVL